MPIDSTFLFRWKTEVMTNSTFLSSPLQLGCRLLSFASGPSCPQTGGLSLCVWLWCSGHVESGFLTGDKWLYLHFLSSGQSTGSQWEHLGVSCSRLGRDERGAFQNMLLCRLMQQQAPASTVIDETLDKNSGLSYHLVSCLYLSSLGTSRGRWGIKNCAHLPVWNHAWTGFYINGGGEAPNKL